MDRGIILQLHYIQISTFQYHTIPLIVTLSSSTQIILCSFPYGHFAFCKYLIPTWKLWFLQKRKVNAKFSNIFQCIHNIINKMNKDSEIDMIYTRCDCCQCVICEVLEIVILQCSHPPTFLYFTPHCAVQTLPESYSLHFRP